MTLISVSYQELAPASAPVCAMVPTCYQNFSLRKGSFDAAVAWQQKRVPYKQGTVWRREFIRFRCRPERGPLPREGQCRMNLERFGSHAPWGGLCTSDFMHLCTCAPVHPPPPGTAVPLASLSLSFDCGLIETCVCGVHLPIECVCARVGGGGHIHSPIPTEPTTHTQSLCNRPSSIPGTPGVTRSPDRPEK
jgi:hypothetical protein